MIHLTHSTESIAKVLSELEASEIHRVAGLKEFKADKPGPRLYLGIGTHGNERMGLALAAPFLRREVDLLRGSVLIALNNVQALHANLRRLPGDRNFNRLPLDILERTDGLYSTARIRALRESGAFDVSHGFDAHTFQVPGAPIKIHIKGPTDLADAIGVKDYITHIVDHQKESETEEPTLAFGNLLGGIENHEIPVVEVEGGGPHTDPEVIRGLLGSFFATLSKLQMVDPSEVGLKKEIIEQRTYQTIGWQRAEPGYSITRDLYQFAPLKAGDVIAEADGRKPVTCPKDACIAMPTKKGVLKNWASWFWTSHAVIDRKETWVLL